MTDPTYNAESHHTPESRERDARFVGHEVKADTSKEAVERWQPHSEYEPDEFCMLAQNDGDWVRFDDYSALLAERDSLREEAEGAHAVIAVERAEALKLREENERLREENEIRSQSAALALGEITALRQDVAALRFALRSIANEATWPDALMSDKDIARAALKGEQP